MNGVETEADWVTGFGGADYTTNMMLEDVTDGPRGSRASPGLRSTNSTEIESKGWP
jgi:hypothetical protein